MPSCSCLCAGALILMKKRRQVRRIQQVHRAENPPQRPCAGSLHLLVFAQFLPSKTRQGGGAMAFCSKCGAQFDGGPAFCPKCGQATGTAAGSPSPAAGNPASGLTENVAGLLCYAFGWVTGIIFLLIDKRPFVRFHAAQSIVTFGALTVLWIAMGMFVGGTLFLGGLGLFLLIFYVVRIAVLVLWILLMVKAYHHKKFRLPIVVGIADVFAC